MAHGVFVGKGFSAIKQLEASGQTNRRINPRINVFPSTLIPDSDTCVLDTPRAHPISVCSPQLPTPQTLHNLERSVVCCPIDTFLRCPKRTARIFEDGKLQRNSFYFVGCGGRRPRSTSVITDVIYLKSRGHSCIENKYFLMRLRQRRARESSSAHIRGA